MTLPNLITLVRLCLVPVIIGRVIAGDWRLAFWLFFAAGLSDALDGFIAKRFGQTSRLGAMLDPLADKALLVSTYVALGLAGALPAWLVILVVARDVMIVAAIGLAWLVGRPMAIAASRLSKVNTAGQIALVLLVLFSHAFAVPLPSLIFAAGAVVGALTLASAAAYLLAWIAGRAGRVGRDGVRR